MRRDHSQSTGEAGANDGLSRRRFLRAAGAAGALTAGAGLAGGTTGGDGPGIQEFERLRVSSDNRIVGESGETFVMRGLSISDPKRLEITKEVRGKGPIQIVDTVTDPSQGWYPRVVRVPAHPIDIGEYPNGDTGPLVESVAPEAAEDPTVRADRQVQRPPQPTEYEEGAFTREQLEAYLEEYYDDVVRRCRERGVYCIVDYHRRWHEQPPGDGEGNGGPEGGAGAENHLPYDSEYTNYWAYNDYYGTDVPASWGYVDQRYRNEAEDPYFADLEDVRSSDDHPYTEWEVNQDLVDEAVMFWDVVAERYADEPHVVFEPYARPTAPGIWGPVEGCASWKQRPLWDVYVEDFATPIMDAIREHAPDTLLLMSVPAWCQSTQALHWRDFEHEDVAVTYHSYPGTDVSGAENWLNDTDYGDDQCNGWQPEESGGLQNAMDVRPVVVTEFGWQDPEYTEARTIRNGPDIWVWCRCAPSGPTTASYGEPFLDAVESDERISWVAWCADVRRQPSMFRRDFPIKEGPFDLVNGSWYETPESEYLLNCPEPPCEWALWDSPNMGAHVKQRLAKNRQSEVPFPVSEAVADPEPIAGAEPTDPDGDGYYEDLNGNGEVDYADVVTYFEHMEEPAMTDHVDAYDYNGNGEIDYDDLVDLFGQV